MILPLFERKLTVTSDVRVASVALGTVALRPVVHNVAQGVDATAARARIHALVANASPVSGAV
jgi:hypothetical protein